MEMFTEWCYAIKTVHILLQCDIPCTVLLYLVEFAYSKRFIVFLYLLKGQLVANEVNLDIKEHKRRSVAITKIDNKTQRIMGAL